MGEGPRPVRVAYLAVVDNEQFYALLIEFRIGQTEPAVVLLDASFQPTEELPLTSWSRQLFSMPLDPRFLRGDATGDGTITVADPVRVLEVLTGDSGKIACADAADANDDGRVTISDAIVLFRHLYNGPILQEDCALDETADDLSDCAYDVRLCVGQ